jgi:hypothetical protein
MQSMHNNMRHFLMRRRRTIQMKPMSLLLELSKDSNNRRL